MFLQVASRTVATMVIWAVWVSIAVLRYKSPEESGPPKRKLGPTERALKKLVVHVYIAAALAAAAVSTVIMLKG